VIRWKHLFKKWGQDEGPSSQAAALFSAEKWPVLGGPEGPERGVRHCANLEELKDFDPPLSHSLQKRLNLHEQLLREVLPVLCIDNSVIFLVTQDALYSDALKSLYAKVCTLGYGLVAQPLVLVDTATLLAARRMLPLAAGGELSETAAASSTESWSDAELFAMFMELIRWGVLNEASDIHINLKRSSTHSPVFYTIAGRYVQPAQFQSMQTVLLRDMLAVAWMNIQGGNAPVFDMFQEQQGRLECDIDGQVIRLRWASLVAVDGPSVCFRIFAPHHDQEMNLDKLGYLPLQQQQLLEATLCERGAIIFSGSVGSGKSTALASLVRQLPSWRKLITLEDPVEYRIPRAIQVSLARDLDTDTHDQFAAKLRALKRSAMTDVLLGEIRDAETAQAFTDLCTSGVRVFTTVHAAGVAFIKQRLSSSFIGVAQELLDTPGVLRLLVHQELLPQLCSHCALPVAQLTDYPPTANRVLYQFKSLVQWLAQIQRLWGSQYNALRTRNAQGCAACQRWQSRGLGGYNGRTVVAHVWQPHETSFWSPSIYQVAWFKAAQGLLDPFDLELFFGLFDKPQWREAASSAAQHDFEQEVCPEEAVHALTRGAA